jgi:hypothetical protein
LFDLSRKSGIFRIVRPVYPSPRAGAADGAKSDMKANTNGHSRVYSPPHWRHVYKPSEPLSNNAMRSALTRIGIKTTPVKLGLACPR